MGVTHKLKPEILNFILENKQNDPALSCRSLTQLILEKFQIIVSKSSINSIFKEHNLSMPIGRRQKHKSKKFIMPVLPVIEGVKAITVVPEKEKKELTVVQEQPEEEGIQENKAELNAEEKRVKEAEEWARKLHEEERIRIEEKLKSKEHGLNDDADAKKKADEADVRALLEEAARVKVKEETKERELEKAAQEAKEKAEQERLAKLAEEETKAATEKKRLEEEAKKIEEEKAAQELAENKRLEEEKKRIELEKAAQEAADKKRLEEAREIEEERLAQEAKQRQQEETAKAEAERKKIEEEAKKIEDEKVAQEAAKVEEQRKRIELEKAAQEAQEKKQLEDERLAREAKEKAEQERLAKLAEEEAKAATERKLLEEEAKKIEEEKAAQEAQEKKRSEEEETVEEAGLKAEKEKWARLAEEEHKAKQEAAGETILPKIEAATTASLHQDGGCPGAILLKALDCLIGGSRGVNEIISRALGIKSEESLPLTEAAIFKSLFGKDNLSGFNDLAGRQILAEKLDNYTIGLKQLDNVKTDISKIITGAFTEARGLKLHFIDGSIINLDSQLHSSWPTQHIPFDFCSPIFELKNNLNNYFFQSQPLVLFSAPGYDVVPKDFFNLILNIGSIDRPPDTLTIFGNKLEELEKISLNSTNNYSMIFGLWPWQFTTTRKVRKIGDFKPSHIAGINKDFYLADIEIDLLRVSLNQSISLKGCAVKTTPSEKIRLVILSNPEKKMSTDELAQIYLSHWPNLDEAFHDFSRKSELFTHAGTTQKFFSVDGCGVDIQAPDLGLEGIFEGYIRMLDTYLRWHFLPSGYTDKNFSFTRDHFYKLPVKLVAAQDKIVVQMQPGQGYQYLKDLEYLLQRLNERQVISFGLRLYFENAFK